MNKTKKRYSIKRSSVKNWGWVLMFVAKIPALQASLKF